MITVTDVMLLQGGWIISCIVAGIIGFKCRDWIDLYRAKFEESVMEKALAKAKAEIETKYLEVPIGSGG